MIQMSLKCQLCVALVRKHEGGYSDNPKDPGNWTGGAVGIGECIGTFYGIDAPTLSAWLHRTATLQDMQNLLPDTADEIYATKFWPRMQGDSLPTALAMVTLDAEVMSGLGGIIHGYNHIRAAGWLQEAIGVSPDGLIGPATIAAANTCDQRAAAIQVCTLRQAFLESLPIWSEFGDGWTTRVQDTQAKALAQIQTTAAP